MTQTIRKSIGEGFAKGELYAALAYDTTDRFGGMKIKGISFNPVAGTPAIQVGDSTTAWTALYGDRAISIYSTCADTGSGNAMPVYISATMNGTGGLGRALEAVLKVTGKLGSYGNALKGYIDLTTGTGTLGLASAICAEMKMPAGTALGTFGVLELELVTPASGWTAGQGTNGANCISLVYAQVSGATAGQFDDYGYLFNIQGLTSTTTHLLYNNTLKCVIGSTVWYLPLSTAEGSFTYGTMANEVGSGVTITDHYSKIIGIYCDATADNSTVGAAAHELYGGEVRQLLHTSSGTYQGEQYAWKGTQRYYGANQIGSYSAALYGKLESAGALTVVGYAGCVAAAISDVQAGNFVLNTGGYLYGFNAYINITAAHTGSGKSVAYLTSIISTHNWDYGLFIPSLTCDTGVGIGDSTTAAAFTAAAQRAIAVYTTTNYTGTANCGSYFEAAMTGVGGAGVGTEVYLKTSVALGNYVAALYAVLDLQTAGGVTGVGSAICGELVLPGGAAGIGTFGVLKLDVVASASWTSSQRVSFFRLRASGSTVATFITNGYLFDINDLGTPADDTAAIWHLTKDTAPTHALRCIIDGVAYDILMQASQYSSN